MKSRIYLFFSAFMALFLLSSYSFGEDDIYYARSNLKVIKGSYITWVNWQATKDIVPAGTELRVTKNGKKATLVEVATGKSYTLDIGEDGDVFLEKFVTREKVNVSEFPEEIQTNIEAAIAKVGMTKEQVYVAMGDPSWAEQNTNSMTYEQIMAEDLWVYKRRRFGKNIGVEFSGKTGKVMKTEGIWE